MALILVKTRYNSEGFRGIANDPSDRRAASEAGFAAANWQLRDMYFLPSSSEWLMIVEGDPENMVAMEVSIMSSGAFEYAHCEVIVTPEAFLAKLSRRANLPQNTTLPTVTRSTACCSTTDFHPYFEKEPSWPLIACNSTSPTVLRP